MGPPSAHLHLGSLCQVPPCMAAVSGVPAACGPHSPVFIHKAVSGYRPWEPSDACLVATHWSLHACCAPRSPPTALLSAQRSVLGFAVFLVPGTGGTAARALCAGRPVPFFQVSGAQVAACRLCIPA